MAKLTQFQEYWTIITGCTKNTCHTDVAPLSGSESPSKTITQTKTLRKSRKRGDHDTTHETAFHQLVSLPADSARVALEGTKESLQMLPT